MKMLSRSLLILGLSVLPALAEFEGMMDMKMTMTGPNGNTMGGGNMKVAVGKPGFRSALDMQMQMPQMTVKMTILTKTATPDVMYRIDDANKTYTEMTIPKSPDAAQQAQDAEKYTVKKLGEEKILGYKTQHVLVIHNATTNELWVAKDFLDYETFKRLQSQGNRGGNEGMQKALKDAGAEGMPLKAIMAGPMGGKMVLEVVKADKQSLPASTFEIPAGYTKSEGGGLLDAAAGVSSPEIDAAKKKMQDAMKNMTPEQRQRIQEMMKQRGAPNQ